MAQDLKNKAIDIKGKKYVLVSDRVLAFNEDFKNGCITTDLLSPFDSELVVMKATVYPDGLQGRYFTGYSQAKVGDGYINKTSALENCETSCVGRALAMMGIGVIDSIASIDEIHKATNQDKGYAYPPSYTPKKDSKLVNDFMGDLEPTEEEIILQQERLESARDVTELKKIWTTVPPMVKDKLEKLKNELKMKLI